MSDGAISVKLAPDYEMGEVQQQLNDYDTLDDIISNDGFNAELSTFKTQSKHDGLEQITAPYINGESVLIYRYKRAVSCLALANLYERYASYDSTNDGEKKMAQLKDSIDELRRDARFAISDILGRKRVDAELI